MGAQDQFGVKGERHTTARNCTRIIFFQNIISHSYSCSQIKKQKSAGNKNSFSKFIFSLNADFSLIYY